MSSQTVLSIAVAIVTICAGVAAVVTYYVPKETYNEFVAASAAALQSQKEQVDKDIEGVADDAAAGFKDMRERIDKSADEGEKRAKLIIDGLVTTRIESMNKDERIAAIQALNSLGRQVAALEARVNDHKEEIDRLRAKE